MASIKDMDKKGVVFVSQKKEKEEDETGDTVHDGRVDTSAENGKKGGRPPAPEFSYIAGRVIRDRYTDKQSGEVTLRHWRNKWLRYTDKGWEHMFEGSLQKELISYLENDTTYGPWATPFYVHGLIMHLSSFHRCGLDDSQEMPFWINSKKPATNYIRFSNNIILNVEALAVKKNQLFKSSSPDFFSTDFVDYPYDKTATCPKFQKYLKRVLPDEESQELARKMFGLMLIDTCKYETFFYLFGRQARNGKTVMLEILSALVGKHNVSHIGLSNLGDRFALWPLGDCKVNIYGDTATDTGYGSLAHIEGVFKDLVSGGAFEYEKKGKDKHSARCRARFVFAGNSLPTFVDRSDAIWERLRIIRFGVQIPKEDRDPDLSRKIISSELPGIFNWAVEGLSKIISDGRIIGTSEGESLKDEHRLNCDHEKQFFEESHYKVGDMKDCVPSKELYEDYCRWCISNNYKPAGKGKFKERVLEMFSHARYEKVKILNSSMWGFRGLVRVLE